MIPNYFSTLLPIKILAEWNVGLKLTKMCVGISEEHHDVITLQLELSNPGGHGIPLLCSFFDYFLHEGQLSD